MVLIPIPPSVSFGQSGQSPISVPLLYTALLAIPIVIVIIQTPPSSGLLHALGLSWSWSLQLQCQTVLIVILDPPVPPSPVPLVVPVSSGSPSEIPPPPVPLRSMVSLSHGIGSPNSSYSVSQNVSSFSEK